MDIRKFQKIRIGVGNIPGEGGDGVKERDLDGILFRVIRKALNAGSVKVRLTLPFCTSPSR